jgi:hypothetical protein
MTSLGTHAPPLQVWPVVQPPDSQVSKQTDWLALEHSCCTGVELCSKQADSAPLGDAQAAPSAQRITQ